MNKKTKCPMCKGEGGYASLVLYPDPSLPKWETCRDCQGEGVVSPAEAKAIKVKHGMAPPR